jgi:phosphoglycerate dehydrogenase-like enzyme/predicted dehydrogenase
MRSGIMTKPAPIRVAVIGAGVTAGLVHLPILAKLRRRGELVLALICDLDEKRRIAARRKYGFLADSSDAVGAATREDVDAVYVLGSAQMHYEYGMLALQYGKHLFVEKPIAPNFALAQTLASAARAGNLTAVGGHNRRFYKSLDTIRVRGGKAGWRFAEAVAHKPEFGKKPPFGARTWLSANGIHALDALLFMMGGLPEHITSYAAGGDPPGRFSAIMRWKGGAQGVFLCDNQAGARREEYVFHAPGETCRVGSEGVFVEKGGRVSRLGRVTLIDGFDAEHQAFLDAIRDRSPPRHAIAALAPSLFLAEQIENGFAGALPLPYVPSLPAPCPPSGNVILVVGGAGLQAPLARFLSGHRLIDLSAVRDAPGPCPEVRAAIMGPGSPPLPDTILDKLPNLGAVGVAGLSLSRHRPEELLSRGVALFNASAAYAETVADFAFALAVLGRRRAFASHDVMRQGGWGAVPPVPGAKGAFRRAAHRLRPLFRSVGLEAAGLDAWRKFGSTGAGVVSRDLRGATIGLIGWSANARAFAERLRRSGAIVLAWSERATAEEMAGVVPSSLEEVLAANIVSLHRGLTPATRHFLGAAELAKLRPGAVLINVARGALIEPQALSERLRQGDIFACLDTYEEEPLDRGNPLRQLSNVFLTSHIAGGSPDMHEAAAAEVIRKVAAWLDGDESLPVALARISTMT